MSKIIKIALMFILVAELGPLDAGAVCLRVPMGIKDDRGKIILDEAERRKRITAAAGSIANLIFNMHISGTDFQEYEMLLQIRSGHFLSLISQSGHFLKNSVLVQLEDVQFPFPSNHEIKYEEIVSRVETIQIILDRYLKINDRDLILTLLDSLIAANRDVTIKDIEDIKGTAEKTRELLREFRLRIKDNLFEIVRLCDRDPEKVLGKWYKANTGLNKPSRQTWKAI
jgi:hypothetical protein